MKTLEEELVMARSRYHQDMLLLEWYIRACTVLRAFGGGGGGTIWTPQPLYCMNWGGGGGESRSY